MRNDRVLLACLKVGDFENAIAHELFHARALSTSSFDKLFVIVTLGFSPRFRILSRAFLHGRCRAFDRCAKCEVNTPVKCYLEPL